MPILSREDHENLLLELLGAELEHTRRTEILQLLRNSHNDSHTQVDELTTNNTKLKSANDDLIISNSKLFRELGVVGGTEQQKDEKKKEDFSKTITIEAIERGEV